jgi:monoamine oxidase
VVVLEARDRIGGRIWSQPMRDASMVVDLGASWIHGTTGNPISEVARDQGIHTVETDYGNATTYCNGHALSADEVLQITKLSVLGVIFQLHVLALMC